MLETIIDQAQNDFSQHLELLQRYIRQPSVSSTRLGIDEMVAMLSADLTGLGGITRVVTSDEFPIVYSRFDEGAERTVLIHSMYDTVEADESKWVAPPFSATRMNYLDAGDCIIGRGAEDTKGPTTSILNMIAAHRAANIRLPVNLILVFEASELGSGGLPEFVEGHQDELRQADVAYWPWCSQRANGNTVAWLGSKGLMTFKLRMTGGDWGGPHSNDLHSSNASWIGSPGYKLVQALASMRTLDDLDVAIDGFYDGRKEPSKDDLRLIAELAKRFDAKAFLRQMGASRFKQEAIADALKASIFTSAFNLSGLKVGNVIEGGHNTVIPCTAVASMDLRLLEGMSIENVVNSMRRHLDSHGFQDVALEITNAYLGGKTPPESWAAKELVGAYRDMGFDPEVWPVAPVAIASSLFTGLGMPWVATCPGQASGKHSANEYIRVEGYKSSIEFIIRLMWRFSSATRASTSR